MFADALDGVGLAGAHMQMSRRARQLQAVIPRKERQKPIHLVVDSTGLKIYGEGEWKVRQHGAGKRRTRRKVHSVYLCTNALLGRLISLEKLGNRTIFSIRFIGPKCFFIGTI